MAKARSNKEAEQRVEAVLDEKVISARCGERVSLLLARYCSLLKTCVRSEIRTASVRLCWQPLLARVPQR